MLVPTEIDKYSDTEMSLAWNNGEKYHLPFIDIRFECPCAVCVDEKTGKRVLKRETIAAGIYPIGIQLIGRYAVQINWNDGHSTGMYHYDRLHEICVKYGSRT